MDEETHDFSKYGELYYMSCISHFREDYPKQIRKYRYSDDNPTLTEADILTFGDSFFDISFQKTLPERLADTTQLKVNSYLTYDPTLSNPFCILNEVNYQKQNEAKYLIYESVERNIPIRFEEPFDAECIRKDEKPGFVTKILNNILFKKNEEQLYDVLLKHSVLTKDIYSAIASFKFDTYNYITTLTPIYVRGAKPWLFYHKQLEDKKGEFYYQYTTEEISGYADNIELLKQNLKSIYNLELLIMLVPNKYTIYHKFVNNDKYNNFIPLLQREMEARGINYVDLYDAFNTSSDTLYYGTDTHWNKKGVDVAVAKTLESMTISN